MNESTNPTIAAREAERISNNQAAIDAAEAYAAEIRAVRKFHGSGPPGDPYRAMVMLVHSFPVLERAVVAREAGQPVTATEALEAGVVDFDAEAFYLWAVEHHNEAARCAARFVLGVWNRSTIEALDSRRRGRRKSRLGPLELEAAMAVWDRFQRAAFVAWCRDPWWP